MGPRIQYVQSKDDVSIAFSVMGEGMPFVIVPNFPYTHLGFQPSADTLSDRTWIEALASKRMLVRYDGRGSGLSQRDINDYSADAHLSDLEAVVDRLDLETFALFASVSSGTTAIAFAARHPERVAKLVLWCTYSSGREFWGSSRARAFRAMRETDWELYTESVMDLTLGRRASEEENQAGAAFFRECVSQEAALQCLSALADIDVTDLLAQVQCSTLVLHRRSVSFMPVELARGLAAGVPDAHLILLEGASVNPREGDLEAVTTAIDDFLREDEKPTPTTEALPAGMAVILFADIVDSTGMTERLGDMAFRDRARELDGSLRSIIREHDGTPVEGKLLGDGVLAVFTSARDAIAAALECGVASDDCGLRLHLGAHAGDVIREDNNVYGGAVNLAARVAAESAPGELLVSDTVRGMARTSAGVTFEDAGERELKGISDPQRLFAVRRRKG